MGLDDDIQSPRTNKTAFILWSVSIVDSVLESTYYARGKLNPKLAITSAMQMVADRLTPTRQCTNVALPSDLPLPDTWSARNTQETLKKLTYEF